MVKRIEKYRYILCFGILLALCGIFPNTGDDWTWGTQVGIDRLNIWFENYSGRYLGNIFVLALTRSNILKTVVMAFCITGIVYCIEKLSKKKWAFYIATVFLLLTPILILREAVVWVSGFSNYTTSIFVSLICISCIYWVFDDKDIIDSQNLKQKPIMAIIMLILGFAGTLIVEHVTLYNLILSISLVVFVVFKFKKVLIQHLAFMMGTVSGTMLMFSNPVYRSVADGNDGYRSFASGITGIIERALENYFDIIYEQLYMNNILLNIAFFVVSLLIFNSLKEKLSKIQYKVSEICLCINGVYLLLSFLSVTMISDTDKTSVLTVIEGVATLISGFALIVLVIIMSLYKKNTQKVVFLIVSILFITATLFVVTPVSSRCFFAGYVLFIVLFAEMCRMLPEHILSKFNAITFKKICTIAISVFLVFYFYIYGTIHVADIKRIEHAKMEVRKGAETVEILRYPYESFLWFTIPINSNFWQNSFKDFYGIPKDVTLSFVTEYTESD